MNDAKPLSREAWEGIVFLVERDGYVMVGANYAPGLIATVRAAEASANAEREACDAMRAAIETVLADDETGPGGWGPDVTMQGVLRESLAADDQHRAAHGEGT